MRRVLLGTLLAALPALADLTLRYTVELKTGPAVPAAVAEAVRQSGGALPPELLYYYRDDGACRTQSGSTAAIYDVKHEKQTTLLIEQKQYAVTERDDSQAISAAVSAEMRKLIDSGAIRIAVTRSPGAAVIQGFRVEETGIKLESPNPEDATRLRATLRYASAEESKSRPVLRQYAEWSQFHMPAGADFMEAGRAYIPDAQMAARMHALVAGELKGKLALRAEVALFLPDMMAELTGKKLEEVAEQPFLTLVLSLREFKEGALPAALFQVPPDYRPAQ